LGECILGGVRCDCRTITGDSEEGEFGEWNMLGDLGMTGATYTGLKGGVMGPPGERPRGPWGRLGPGYHCGPQGRRSCDDGEFILGVEGDEPLGDAQATTSQRCTRASPTDGSRS
jgi:hypothetical protein